MNAVISVIKQSRISKHRPDARFKKVNSLSKTLRRNFHQAAVLPTLVETAWAKRFWQAHVWWLHVLISQYLTEERIILRFTTAAVWKPACELNFILMNKTDGHVLLATFKTGMPNGQRMTHTRVAQNFYYYCYCHYYCCRINQTRAQCREESGS